MRSYRYFLKPNETKTTTSKNLSSIRKLIRKRMKCLKGIPPLIHNNSTILDDSEKCSIFSQTFMDNFSSPQVSTSPQQSVVSPSSANNPNACKYLFEPYIVKQILRKLTPKIGFSLNYVNFYILKHCATPLALPLSLIFTQSFEEAILPDAWKHATVLPIPKKGNPAIPSNYRPISLTDHIARVMEKVICSRIRIDYRHLISPHQHGFLDYRSCTTSLTRSTSLYHEILKQHNSLDVLFFDFSKAFDQVSHIKLIEKLEHIGIHSNYTRWFESFLTNRSFSLKVNSITSTQKYSVPSGVPQGTVSGPLLFILFINDLLHSIPPTVHFSCFADDIKLFGHSPSELQAAIDLIANWSKDNQLPLAPAKTALLQLGKKNSKNVYTVDNITVSPTNSVRDLGLYTDSKLTFKPHINRATSLALLRAKQILKCFSSSSPKFYINMYKTYVSPILEYGSVIYSPPPTSNLSSTLESLLKYFSKRVLQRCNFKYKIKNAPQTHNAFSKSYENRLKILGISSARSLRLRAQLLLLYKILTGAAHFPKSSDFVTLANSSRRPMLIKIKNPKCRSFFSQVVPIWNSIVRNSSFFLSPSQFLLLLDCQISKF
nr:hypothetical protein C49A1.8 - Caenorhabditis elegans [Caenorhabditis elegans]